MMKTSNGYRQSHLTTNRRKIFDTTSNEYVNNAVAVLPIKCGYMIKRSQNKKRFTPVNYKTRWFELDRQYLRYFDIENVESEIRGRTLTNGQNRPNGVPEKELSEAEKTEARRS